MQWYKKFLVICLRIILCINSYPDNNVIMTIKIVFRTCGVAGVTFLWFSTASVKCCVAPVESLPVLRSQNCYHYRLQEIMLSPCSCEALTLCALFKVASVVYWLKAMSLWVQFHLHYNFVRPFYFIFFCFTIILDFLQAIKQAWKILKIILSLTVWPVDVIFWL